MLCLDVVNTPELYTIKNKIMRSYIIFFLSILLAVFAFVSGCEKNSNKEEGVYYTCPMHPEVRKDEPGQCPICNMDLVKKEDHTGHQH